MATRETLSYPQPPAHYAFFASGPTAMQPPELSGLGPTYRMFGQVVKNPSVSSNAAYPVPPVDRDVLMYDPKYGVKKEIVRLVGTLKESVMSLLDAVQNRPNDSGREVRDFDNRIKSLFHALEVLRPVEAKEVVLRMTQDEIRIREAANEKCEQVINSASSLLV